MTPHNIGKYKTQCNSENNNDIENTPAGIKANCQNFQQYSTQIMFEVLKKMAAL